MKQQIGMTRNANKPNNCRHINGSLFAQRSYPGFTGPTCRSNMGYSMKIVGAGGHEINGLGEGTIGDGARDEEGIINRRVRFRCTTVPGLGLHYLTSTGTSRRAAKTTFGRCAQREKNHHRKTTSLFLSLSIGPSSRCRLAKKMGRKMLCTFLSQGSLPLRCLTAFRYSIPFTDRKKP